MPSLVWFFHPTTVHPWIANWQHPRAVPARTPRRWSSVDRLRLKTSLLLGLGSVWMFIKFIFSSTFVYGNIPCWCDFTTKNTSFELEPVILPPASDCWIMSIIRGYMSSMESTTVFKKFILELLYYWQNHLVFYHQNQRFEVFRTWWSQLPRTPMF